jgi:hypothetical protein
MPAIAWLLLAAAFIYAREVRAEEPAPRPPTPPPPPTSPPTPLLTCEQALAALPPGLGPYVDAAVRYGLDADKLRELAASLEAGAASVADPVTRQALLVSAQCVRARALAVSSPPSPGPSTPPAGFDPYPSAPSGAPTPIYGEGGGGGWSGGGAPTPGIPWGGPRLAPAPPNRPMYTLDPSVLDPYYVDPSSGERRL